jgi:hypothetical protein
MNEPLERAIIAGKADTATALAGALLARGASAREILDGALLQSMAVQRAKELAG